MPYLAHFGLRDHPFTLTPNTQQYFPTSGNTQVLQSLDYGIHRNSGIMKVVGEVGTGKTLLCRLLLRQLEGRTEVAYLSTPQADSDALIALVCHEFGLEAAPGATRADMLKTLNDFLLARYEEDIDCVLVVDEAQALGVAGLEAIRLLSNLETETAKLLQIVLFGQTELDALLGRPDLRQINQRIAFGFGTGPLTRAEGVSYIQHRLRQARQEGIEWRVFDPKAVERIIAASGGVPRVINILCDKALLIAYGEGDREVTRTHVQAAIKDSPTLVQSSTEKHDGRRVALVAGLGGVLAGAGIAAAVLLGGLGGAVAPAPTEEPASQAAAPTPAPAPTSPPPASTPEPAAKATPEVAPARTPPPAPKASPTVEPTPVSQPNAAPASTPDRAPEPDPAPAAAPAPTPRPKAPAGPSQEVRTTPLPAPTQKPAAEVAEEDEGARAPEIVIRSSTVRRINDPRPAPKPGPASTPRPQATTSERASAPGEEETPREPTQARPSGNGQWAWE